LTKIKFLTDDIQTLNEELDRQKEIVKKARISKDEIQENSERLEAKIR
jgi:hypothetical protein